jgi:hypothetical protein
MKGVEAMKDKLNGWHIVILVALVLGTIVALVQMGETLGAVVAAALAILAVLGYNTAQNKTNNDLANGRLKAFQDQVTTLIQDHTADLARKDAQFALERAQMQAERAQMQLHIKEASDKAAAYAAQVLPPDPTRAPEGLDGLARLP